MALDFSRYYSKGKATTDKPAFPAAESTQGEVTETYGKVGAVAQEGAYKLGLAYQEARRTQAELNQKTQIDDMLLRAEQDPDINGYEKYKQENDKFKTETANGLKNDREAVAKTNFYAAAADRQLQSMFHKKMIANQQVNTLQLLDRETSNPSEATPGRIKEILDRQKSLGFIDEKTAYDLEQKYTKQAKQNAFLSDLSVSSDLAKENLKTYGFDLSEMEKAKNIIANSEKKEEEQFKNAQMETVNAFGEKLAKQELTVEEVEDAISTGLIDAEMGAAFELALASPDRWSEFAKDEEISLRADNFIKPLESLAKSQNADQRMKIIKSALKNRNDGKLNASDLNFILRVGAGKSKEPEKPIWGFLSSAISSIPAPTKVGGKIAQKFMSRWDMQEDPRPVMQQAAQDQFKEDHPETAAYTLDTVIKRKSGSYKVVGFNEDGSPVFKKL